MKQVEANPPNNVDAPSRRLAAARGLNREPFYACKTRDTGRWESQIAQLIKHSRT